MGLQMGLGGSSTLSREAKRSVSFQVGGRWHLRDLTKNRGREQAGQLRDPAWGTDTLQWGQAGDEGAVPVGSLSDSVSQGHISSSSTSGIPTARARSAPSERQLSFLWSWCPLWAGELLQGSRQGHESPCLCECWLGCVWAVTTATKLWKCGSHRIM